MNEQEKWLRERIAAGATGDLTELPFIERLGNQDISEADLSSCIDCLEVLLSLDALIPLINFIKNDKRSMILRKQAAKAVSVIGSNYVESDLRALLSSPVSELRLLAEIALGTPRCLLN